MEKCSYCSREFKNYRALIAHISVSHRDEYLKQNVKILQKKNKTYDILDISNLELENLRKNHSGICDICGKIETANTRPESKDTPNNLCVDHDHNTKKFRGFLCVQCNRNMGWYDKYKNQIFNYVNQEKESFNS